MVESKPGAAFIDNGDSFASLFEGAESEASPVDEGQIVTGRVIHVGKEHVVVDIGYKSEGIIPLYEFQGTSGSIAVTIGDKVEVFVESRETEDGQMVLSKERADRLRVWDEIASACEGEEIIEGTISGRVKGGLAVTIRGGVRAFLPGSQVDLRPTRNLDQFIGKTYPFRVIKFNRKRGNIVLSRRALLEKEREVLKTATLEKLQEGMVVEGVIKNLTEYGAFVDLGGVDGLLHVTDMSWGRVNHPSEVFRVGDKVKVMVLKFNAEQERISLGVKQTQDDPWILAHIKYAVGARCNGKSVSLTDYGSFVEIEPGIEGLVHISEMSWTKRVNTLPGRDRRAARGRRRPRVTADATHLLGLRSSADPGRCSPRSSSPAPRSRASSGRSPTTASSSRSRKASTGWSTRTTSRGRSASAIPPRCSARRRRSRPSSSTSTTTRRRSRWG